MKKFFVLSLMVLSMICFASCGSSDDSKEENNKEGNKDGGNGNSTVVDENILEVPADQDNTVGAPCDDKTFIEFCDGNAYVDCSEEYVEEAEGEGEYKYVVRKYECSGEAPVCFVSKYKSDEENKEYNWAACYSLCEKEDPDKGQGCTTYDSGYSFMIEEYECVETSKGRIKFSEDSTLCNSACSEDGKTCEIKKCDPSKDKPYCDENGVLHECAEWSGLESAYFCGSMKLMTCRYDEDFGGFGCFDDPYAVDEDLAEVPADQDNTEGASCDTQTFIEFCDGNTVIYCSSSEFDQNGYVVKAKCDADYPVCFTHAYEFEGEPWNIAGCYASCDGENVGDGKICRTPDSGYTFELQKYRCIETSKGKLKFIDGSEPCNSACSEDGRSCEIKECDPEKDRAYCDENGVLHECVGWSDTEMASFCNANGSDMVCEYIEYDDRFGCNYNPPD